MPTEDIRLESLHLDAANARFGRAGGGDWEEADVLDHIVKTFGVDDVLSSIAINGYISAEPLVVRRETSPDAFTVVEGNRRLAACLIITGDSRAIRQKTRTKQYHQVWRDHVE